MKEARLRDALLRGTIWSFIGVIYAFVFVVFATYFETQFPAPWNLILATISSTALTVLVYGSIRLTFLTASMTFVATLAWVAINAGDLKFGPLLLLGAAVGALCGITYSQIEKQTRIYCAEAKLIAGLVSGAVSSIALAFCAWLGVSLNTSIGAILMAPVVGIIYVSSAYWFVNRCKATAASAGDGALVGIAAGSVTALFFTILASTIGVERFGLSLYETHLTAIGTALPDGLLGAALICFVVGALRGMLGTSWYDL